MIIIIISIGSFFFTLVSPDIKADINTSSELFLVIHVSVRTVDLM